MNKDALDTVLKSFEVLIAAELKAPDLMRFRRVAKICIQAHSLAQMGALRVEDQMEDPDLANDLGMVDVNILGNNPMGMQGPLRRRINRPVFIGGNDHVDNVDLMREALALAAPLVKAVMAKKKDENAHRLLSLRDRLVEAGRPTDEIDKQIDKAVAEAAKEDTDADPNSAVLRPELLRGHQALLDGAEAVQGDRGEGDGEGAGGARGGGEGGPQEEVDLGFVGEPLQDGADGALRADRQGGGDHRQGAQAGAEDALGREVR